MRLTIASKKKLKIDYSRVVLLSKPSTAACLPLSLQDNQDNDFAKVWFTFALINFKKKVADRMSFKLQRPKLDDFLELHNDAMAEFWTEYNSHITVFQSVHQAVRKAAQEKCRHDEEKFQMSMLLTDAKLLEWLRAVINEILENFDRTGFLLPSIEASKLVNNYTPVATDEQLGIVHAAIDELVREEIHYIQKLRTKLCNKHRMKHDCIPPSPDSFRPVS